uniref:Chemosensory protein n=2 Tax=Neoptera TaxID=33340 RepID=A0A6M9BJX9_9NEOP|nr:chemosensory protein [Histia rhodope]
MRTFGYILLLCCVYAVTGEDEKYTDKFDNIDVKEILENSRLLLAYINCLLETGKCSPEGTELKKHMAEALSNGCKKCTEKQLDGVKLVVKHFVNHDKENWEKLVAKYDPTGEYTKKYEKEAKESGINLSE